MVSILIEADAVIDHNGDVVGDAILVDGGVIHGVGVKPSYASKKVIRGYVLPGFIDAHLHIKGLGTSLYGANLRGSKSPDEVAARLARVGGAIAIGRGWDQESFEDGGYPDRQVLDKYIKDRPAVAIRVCGHMATLNTEALRETQPWKLYPDQVDRERGIIVEDAVYYVVNKLLSMLDEVELVKLGVESLYGSGVVGASSMACSTGEIEALLELSRRGELPIRVACYANRENYTKYMGLHSGFFGVVGLKLFSDGSFGARTAALREDYEDDPGNKGRLLMNSKEIIDIGERVLKAGYRLAVHAIGDRALDEVLQAYRALNPGPRARVEHASMTWREHVDELAELGVYTVVQPRFRLSDWWLPQRLGGRVSAVYRFKTMLMRGVKMAISTDAPVEDHRPWETIKVAQGICGPKRCTIGEDLGPREALRLYTVEAAAASGGPVTGLGRIEVGAPAALVRSLENPLERGWGAPVEPISL